jgi:putative transposase
MNQFHPNKQFAPFCIGPHDRVTIGGKAFRLAHQSNDAYVLFPAEGEGLAATFTFGSLSRLNAAGKIRHDVQYFLPQCMRTHNPLGLDGISLSMLPEAQRKRMNIRYAMVQGYKSLLSEGVVQPNDVSIRLNMSEICERAGEWLAE